jgi:hydroxyacylglutathione hydrolase
MSLTAPSSGAAPGIPTLRAVIVPVTPFQQNCSIIWCEKTKRAAIVDPGGGLDRLRAILAERGLQAERILVTHGHVDHAAAVADARDALGVPVEGPTIEDEYWIMALRDHGAQYGMAYARPFIPDRWLHDKDQVQVGEQTLDVLHCPGHTPGHVAFFHAPSRFALVGDILFEGSVGRTDFPGGSMPDLVRSIRDKLFPLGDDVTFLPGHGAMSTFGRERASNPYVGDRALSR